MQAVKSIIIILLAVSVSVSVAKAQGRRAGGDDFIIRTEEALKGSGHPLTAEQKTKLESLGDNRREMMNVLSDEQKEALRNSWRDTQNEQRESAERRGGRGNFVDMTARILDEAGKPLSDDQKAKLQAIEPGPDMREKFNEILSEDQQKALEEARSSRGGRGNFADMIAERLKDSKHPLTEEQKKKLSALTPGQGMREEINKILTKEQQDILQAARGNRGGNNGGGRFGGGGGRPDGGGGRPDGGGGGGGGMTR